MPESEVMMRAIRFAVTLPMAAFACLLATVGGCDGTGLTLNDMFTDQFLSDTGIQENAFNVSAPGGNLLAIKATNGAFETALVTVNVLLGTRRLPQQELIVSPGNKLGTVIEIPQPICDDPSALITLEAQAFLGVEGGQNVEFVLPLTLISSDQEADFGIFKFRDFDCGDTVDFVIQEDPSVPEGFRLAARIFKD